MEKVSCYERTFQREEPNFTKSLSDLGVNSPHQVWKNVFRRHTEAHCSSKHLYSNRGQPAALASPIGLFCEQ